MAESVALGGLAWALTYLVHSTVLLALAWGALRWLRRLDPTIRARAWQAALLGGILTASVQLGAGLEPLGGRLTLTDLAGAPTAGPAPVQPALLGALSDRAAATGATPTLDRAAAAPSPASLPPEPTDDRLRRAIALAWAFGAAWGLFRFLTRSGRFRAHVADRLPVWDERALGGLERLRHRAGVSRPVRLSRSPSIRVPLTWGVVRPEICVPERALSDLSPAEFEAVLAHELGHVARGDALWLALGQWLGAVLFFQPLNRIARRGLAREAEHLADAFAVRLTRRPVTLARCLAKVAGWLDDAAARPASAEVAAVGMASSRGVLRERVERLLEPLPAPRRRRLATLVVVGVPALLLPLAPAVAADRASTQDRGAPVAGLVEVAASRATLARPGLASGDAFVDPHAPLEALLDELVALRREVEALAAHPAADAHAEELALLRARLDALNALGERARAIVADTPPSPSRTASRGGAFRSVPDRP